MRLVSARRAQNPPPPPPPPLPARRLHAAASPLRRAGPDRPRREAADAAVSRRPSAVASPGAAALPPDVGGLSRHRDVSECGHPATILAVPRGTLPRSGAGVVVLLLLLLLVLLVLLCWLCRQRLGYATLPSSLTAQQMLREWVQLHHVLRHSPEHAESEAQGHAEPAASAAGGDRDTDPSPTYTISFQPAPPPPPPPPANFPWRRGERASVGIGP
ncbi:unnamed protein product [Lampetra fluviatilis]